MPAITIRPATAADAAPLSAFAAQVFAATFGPDNTPEDMALYLAEAFAPERQAAEIADPAGAVLVAEALGAAGVPDAAGPGIAGYAHLVAGPAPAAVTGPAPVELSRLYVAPAWHGRGVAAALMDAALDAARARRARTLWLGVWERNPRAVRFYEKYGFRRVGEHAFTLGRDVQTDWIMARAVIGPSAANPGRTGHS